MLPYLYHDEIMKFEQCCKKTLIYSSYWPVWKNIYQEQHRKHPKIAADISQMNNDEQKNNDYRGACKRCFIYLKKNVEEEIPPDLVDYIKGEKVIIIEEFTLSIVRLPEAYIYPIQAIEVISDKMFAKIEPLHDSLMNSQYVNRQIEVPKSTPA